MSDQNMIELCARMAHETNRAWCEANGDMTQFAWDNAPEWQKDSARKGVRFVFDNPTAGDSAQHDAWCRDKIADGWEYGPEKDAEKKTHPCLVSFELLPLVQRTKDRLFRAVVLAVYAPEAL